MAILAEIPEIPEIWEKSQILDLAPGWDQGGTGRRQVWTRVSFGLARSQNGVTSAEVQSR